jgi:hypothetical protein
MPRSAEMAGEYMSAEFADDDISSMLVEMENDSKKVFQKKFWSLASDFEGTQKIRFLPQSKVLNEKVFYKKHRVHWLNSIPYECLSQTMVDKNGKLHEAEDCPICKHVKKLYAIAGDEKESEEKRVAGSISAKDRYIFRVIVRGKRDKEGNNIESQPEFFEAGKTIFENLYMILKGGEYGNFLSINEGRDYNLTKRGKGRNAKYDGSMPAANISKVFTDSEQLKQLVKNIEKMGYDQLIEFKSYDEVKTAINTFINPNEVEETSSYTERTTTVGVAPSTSVLGTKKEEAKSSSTEDDLDDILNQF